MRRRLGIGPRIHFLPILIYLGLSLSLSGCWSNQKAITIKIEAFTDDDQPIPQATILLNGEPVGETNDTGQAVIETELDHEQRNSLEVRKESADRYYAPYFESFVLEDQSPGKMRIKAILYSVPKPTPRAMANDDASPSDEADDSQPSQQITAAEQTTQATDDPQTDDATGTQNQAGLSPSAAESQELSGSRQQKPAETANNTISSHQTDNNKDKVVQAQAKPEPEPEQPAAQVARIVKPHSFDEKQSTRNRAKATDQADEQMVTFYTHDQGKPVSNAQIMVGFADAGRLQAACETNQRGRCIWRGKLTGSATILARKQGHRTKRLQRTLSDGDRLRLAMPKGQSIDIFAVYRRYGFGRGLADVNVSIDGKSVGQTDEFGHFSHFYQGQPGDLVEVGLQPKKGYLPQAYTTDYIVAGPMSLVKYFAPVEPDPVRIAVLPVQAAGRLANRTLAKFDGNLNQMIRRAMNQYFFKAPSFRSASVDKLDKELAAADKNWSHLMRDGWASTPLKGWLDAIMVPTIVLQDPLALELSFVDSQGQVLIADKHELVSYSDRNAIANAAQQLARKIQTRFPFEGTIIGKDDEALTINLGSGEGHALQVNDELAVYGIQADRLGRHKKHTHIGRVRVTQVQKQQSRVRIIETAPRSLIDVGDQVIFSRKRQAPSDQTMVLSTQAQSSQKPISQANVYFDQKWIGATDRQGELKLSSNQINGRGVLHVIKHGFRDFTREITARGIGNLQVTMNRESSFLRVDSQPSGADIFIDQKLVGQTPLAKPVALPTGFIKLRIEGPDGYKPYEQVLELDEGTLDLTGDRRVQLEKDIRRQAQQLVDSGKIRDAIDLLAAVTPEHSDYLMAQHEVGELYLSVLDQPAEAAKAFAKVTGSRQVKTYQDKRFIGSHVNEGVALFMTGRQLENQSAQAAVAHYRKAVETFDQVEPHLRHINQLEYAQAVHNVAYYRALAHHRTWEITQDPLYLNAAHRSWRRYLNHSAKTTPLKRGDTLVRNAKIYLRQTEASLSTMQPTANEERL
jgi:hypothetical protein